MYFINLDSFKLVANIRNNILTQIQENDNVDITIINGVAWIILKLKRIKVRYLVKFNGYEILVLKSNDNTIKSNNKGIEFSFDNTPTDIIEKYSDAIQISLNSGEYILSYKLGTPNVYLNIKCKDKTGTFLVKPKKPVNNLNRVNYNLKFEVEL